MLWKCDLDSNTNSRADNNNNIYLTAIGFSPGGSDAKHV